MNKANLDNKIKNVLLKISEEETIYELKKTIDNVPEWIEVHQKFIAVLDEMWFLLMNYPSETSINENELHDLGDKILRAFMHIGTETMRRRILNFSRLLNQLWAFLGPVCTFPNERWSQLNTHVDELHHRLMVCLQ